MIFYGGSLNIKELSYLIEIETFFDMLSYETYSFVYRIV